MSALAIITARGGSKRIPKKNIKNFLGKPIIEYSIEAALNSGIFDEVMVSTDDEEIRKIALNAGGSVPFMRTGENSDDYAMTHEVLLEVLDEYKKIGMEFDYIACIYPTAPFVTSKKLTECMDILVSRNADSVVPVVAFSYPPQRAFVMKENTIKYKWPENMFRRSQDLDVMYHDSGQFYFLNTAQFLLEKKMIMENTVPFFLNESEVQDIDNMEDWKIAELKYTFLKNRKELD